MVFLGSRQDCLRSHNLHNAKLLHIQKLVPRSSLKCRNCEHVVHWSCSYADFQCTPQYCCCFVYMTNQGCWTGVIRFIASFLSSVCWRSGFCSVFLLGLLVFVTIKSTSYNQVEFRRQIKLPQINVIVTISLKLNFNAVSIHWHGRINLLVMRW